MSDDNSEGFPAAFLGWAQGLASVLADETLTGDDLARAAAAGDPTARLAEQLGMPLEASELFSLIGWRLWQDDRQTAYAQALRYFTSAAELTKDLSGPRADFGYAGARLGEATVLTRLPNAAQAMPAVLSALREALSRCPIETGRERLPFDIAGVWAEVMASPIGDDEVADGDAQAVLKFVGRLRAISPGQPDRRYLASEAEGMALARLGDPTAAKDALVQAVEGAKQARDRGSEGFTLARLGNLLRTTPQLRDDLESARLQLQAADALRDARRLEEAASCGVAAAVLFMDLGRWRDAANALEASADHSEQAWAAAALDREVTDRTWTLANTRQALGYCLARIGRADDAAVEIDRARARRFRSIPTINDAGFKTVVERAPELAQAYREIQAAIRERESWEVQLLRSNASGDLTGVASVADDLDVLRAERATIIEQMRAVGGVGEALMPRVTIERIRAAIPRDSCLAYVIATPYGGLAVLVTETSTSVLELETLTLAALQQELERVKETYDAVRGTDGAPSDFGQIPAWVQAMNSAGQWSWDVLMGPLTDAIATKRLILVACGGLEFLPLHAAWQVRDGSPEREFAIDRTVITYSPCVDLQPSPESIREGLGEAGLVAAEPAPVLADPLPAASLEAAIGKAFQRRRVLEHQLASAANVAESIARYDGIHFACHGWTEFGVPYASRILLAYGAELTVSDIVDTRLPNGPSVFLSACETNLRDIRLADEVQTLAAAFLAAGARDVIGTLWFVNDLPALLIALKTYDNRRGGESGANALRAAQLWLRDTPIDVITRDLESITWLDPEVLQQVQELIRIGPVPDLRSVENWAPHTYLGA